MKLIITKTLILLTFITLNAQVYNKGEIILEKNSKIRISSTFTNYEKGLVDNSGTIELNNDWINHSTSNVFKNNKGNVVFTGDIQKIKINNTEFGKLEFKNNSITNLETNISIDQEIVFNNGKLDLNGHSLIINNPKPTSIKVLSGSIFNNNSNSRLIWRTGNSDTTYSVPFSNDIGNEIPMTFEILKVGEGLVELNTYPTDNNNYPLPTGIQTLTYGGNDISNLTIDRFWFIDPKGADLKVSFTFDSIDIENNQIEINNLELLHYNGSEWILDTLGKIDQTKSYISEINKTGWYTLISHKPLNTSSSIFESANLELFPNPTSDFISFKLVDNNENFEIEVLNIYGEKVFHTNYVNKNGIIKMDISALKKSMYIITLKQSNFKVYFSKFIKL